MLRSQTGGGLGKGGKQQFDRRLSKGLMLYFNSVILNVRQTYDIIFGETTDVISFRISLNFKSHFSHSNAIFAKSVSNFGCGFCETVFCFLI